MTTPYMHDGFKYLKENVRIKVIPIVNPWAFNQNPKKYGTVNGVNINRNFDSNGRWEKYPVVLGSEIEYKGPTPFSEKETQILRDWAIENKRADFWIDCHTGLNNPHVDNWVYYLSHDKLAPKVLSTLAKLEERIRVKYNKPNPTKLVQVDHDSLIRGFYSLEQLGLSTITLELANSFWGTGLNLSLIHI